MVLQDQLVPLAPPAALAEAEVVGEGGLAAGVEAEAEVVEAPEEDRGEAEDQQARLSGPPEAAEEVTDLTQ